VGNTWVTDLRHLLDLRDPAVAHKIPAPARNLGEYFGSIVEAVSAGWEDHGELVATMVRCRRRPGRKPCPGRINAVIANDIPGDIEWRCDNCDDRGIISHWRGTPWDLPGVEGFEHEEDEARVLVDLLVREEEYDAIRGILVLDDLADRVVKAARGVGDGDVLLEAPRAWLDHLLEFVAAEVEHTANRTKRALLDAVMERA